MYKLAVIDDEAEMRDTLCSCFPWEQAGFTIEAQLDNGEKALKYLIQHPIHAILCDIKMPRMNGIELAREIQQRKLPVQVVLLSGLRDFEMARQAIGYGVRHYLVKPAKYNDLQDVLSKLKQDLDLLQPSIALETAVEPDELQQDEGAGAVPHPVILRIIRYAESDYATATLEEAAQLVHMNPSYVSSLFRKVTGSNFSDHLHAVRMKKAAELLRERRWTAAEVSEMVGYANAKNFIRAFKQYFGTTPGQFKRES